MTDRYPKLAVLLAAGLGKRLVPFTYKTPKSLLTAGGKPLLDYAFNALKQTDIEKVVVVTHHLENQIISYVNQKHSKSFDIEFCHQPVLDGSAGALRSAAEMITTHQMDSLLVCATDYQMPVYYLKRLIGFHLNGSQSLSIGMRKVSAKKVTVSNMTTIDGDDKILSIFEKPSAVLEDKIYTACYLIYILPVYSLRYLGGLELSKRREFELPDLVNEMINDDLSARGYLGDEFFQWEDGFSPSI